MDEAVKVALRHSPQIARAEALLKASVARTGIARAPFWPDIGADYSYWDADRDPNLASDDLSSTSTYISYNLFNGGSDWFQLEASRSRKEAAQWQYQSTIADTVLEVRKAYIEALRAKQSLETSGKSLELLERQYRDAELRLEVGMIARNDLLRIAVEKATAQQNLITADGNLVVARQNLARAIGQPLAEEERLSAVSYNELQTESYDDMQREMIRSRSELKYLQSRLDAQMAERKATYGDLLPEVDISHSYDQFGNDAFPDSDDTDYDSGSTTMVQASWTLFSGFDTRYELAVSKHESAALKEEIRATENVLQVQLRSALEGYRTAKTNLETARASLALAEENYRVNENRYKAQVATTVDLLDAQEFLTRARNEELKAQYDLYTAEAVIDRVLERDNTGGRTSDQ
jgi:outer membrane protein TolC